MNGNEKWARFSWLRGLGNVSVILSGGATSGLGCFNPFCKSQGKGRPCQQLHIYPWYHLTKQTELQMCQVIARAWVQKFPW